MTYYVPFFSFPEDTDDEDDLEGSGERSSGDGEPTIPEPTQPSVVKPVDVKGKMQNEIVKNFFPILT